MFGPYTPTLLSLLTRSGKLKMPRMAAAAVAAGGSGGGGGEFAGKVAVITGAASGIGAALARRCVAEGCGALVLADNAWDHSHDDGDNVDAGGDHPLLRELREGGVEVLAMHVDVGAKDDILKLHAATMKRFGPPSLLFNNAGTGMPGVLSASEDALQRSFDINFWSVVHAMRIFVPSMEQHQDKDQTCHIVNTASLAGVSEACGLYGVTKHGVVAATEAVASELAWRKSNVRVSVLCPSYVASNVAATTARSALNDPPAAAASTTTTVPSEDAEQAELAELFSGLGSLIAHGATPEAVADVTFAGIKQGRKYIYTDEGHTEAAIDDRVEQLRAGGLPEHFQRRMEAVVTREMERGAGAAQQRRSFSTDARAAAAAASSHHRLREDSPAADTLREILSPSRLSFSAGVIDNHASLESGFYGWMPPDAVAFAESTEEVSAVLRCCHEHRIPVVPYGTGTSVEGHIDCTRGGLMLDVSGMNAILSTNEADMDATVQAGVTREHLNEQLRHSGLFFSVDPGANASIGGMVSTNASGTTTLRYGSMHANVLGLTAVMADGEIVCTGGRSRKSSAGYDLTRLLIGSEGTLAVVTEVTVKLHPHPTSVSAAVCQFDSLASAVDAATATTYVATPARMELLDAVTMQCLDGYQGQSFEHAPCIFFEFHGATEEAVVSDVDALRGIVEDYGGSGFEWATTPEDRTRLWRARHDAFWAVKAQWPGTDLLATDVCVPVSRLAEIIEATADDIEQLDVIAAPLFGHVGDGNFHLLVVFDSANQSQVDAVRQLEHKLVNRAIEMEGTCTGEHGIGTSKIQYLEPELGAGAVRMMQMIKASLDPRGILNPDKVVRAERSGEEVES